jgi:hypothetical protein
MSVLGRWTFAGTGGTAEKAGPSMRGAIWESSVVVTGEIKLAA